MFIMDDEEEETKTPETKLKLIDGKIDEALLKARRIFFCDVVDMDSARDTIRKLWYLELTEPGKPILLVINSPGGSVDAGFAIWDQVQMISSPVTTLVTGLAASMGSILSLCAAPKKRFATPHAQIMIHQPRIHGVIQGQATDIRIHAKQITNTREKLVAMYVNATGKKADEIDKAIDRDCWFSAQEALKFGLINGIITSFKELK
jgi:ATP-dependent Clp protease protease subunit